MDVLLVALPKRTFSTLNTILYKIPDYVCDIVCGGKGLMGEEGGGGVM